MGGKLPPFAIADTDGTPTVWQPTQIYFPNGAVTDIGNGTVFVNTGPGGGTTLSAATPILIAANTIQVNTSGATSSTYWRGDFTWAVPPSGVAYAPSNSTYIVQTPDGILTNEQALNQLVTGLVKNTSGTGILSIATTNVDYVDTSRSVTIVAPLSGGGDLSTNRVIAILSSTVSSDGYLKGVDFATFNAKASTATTITVLSPLSGGGDLSANRTIALTTDGNTANFLNGAGVFTTPSGGSSIVYAPTGATYILQTNNAALASAQILAALSNGLLKSVSGTGIISIASGGVDFENILTAATPLLRRANVFSLQTDGATTTYLRGDGTYRSVYEARSPFLSAGTILSLLTDGATTTYLRGDGTYRSVYEARSPLLSAGTVVSLNTSGVAKQYLTGAGSWGPVTTMQTSATLNLVATGEFGLDTSDDAFMVYNTTTGRIYAHFIQPVSFCFAASNNTWVNETLPICAMRSNMAVTMQQVDVTVVGAQTPTLTFQLEIRNFTGYNSSGIITTATANIVAQHTGTVITSFSNATIGARAALFITTRTAVTAGTANFLMGTVYYTMNQE